MKKIFSILLSLALVVGLSLATAAPVMAVTLPSISPTTGEYDMDNPGHVATTITWGVATSLTLVEYDSTSLTLNTDYYRFEGLVVITEAFLDSVLDCIGDEVILHLEFDVGDCYLTVTAVGTPPALEEDEAEWGFWGTDDVVVGIDWGIAGDVVSVKEIVGGVVVDTLVETTEWAHNATTLTIMGDTAEYLPTRLTSIGDDVELTVTFDSCDYDIVLTSVPHTFVITIEAVGVTAPRVAPTSATYDLCLKPSHPDMTFTITWDGATAGSGITSIKDVTGLSPPYPITLASPTVWTVSGNTLTIKDSWLITKMLAAGSSKYLEITFDDPATTKVNILITAAWSAQPWMGVTSNIYTYDLDTGLGNLGASGVGSLVNLGCATNVTGVHDGSIALAVNTQYLVQYIVGYGYLCIITKLGYLQFYLTYLGDSATFNVAFDKGANATFIVNAVGTQPAISPTSAEFNLDAPANVTTTVTLGPHATSYVIKNVDDVLTENVDYVVSGNDVTILDTYLSSVLEEIDDVVVLKFDFDEGNDANLTIRAVGTPLCFVATAAGADAPALDILREFRDVVLRPNSLGAKLVSLYYEASPPIAELISQNEALKTAVRVCLIDPIVAILNWSHCLWS